MRDAHTIVSNSPLTNDGFRSAWANLTERFENKRLLVDSQLKILFSVQSDHEVAIFPIRLQCRYRENVSTDVGRSEAFPVPAHFIPQ